MLQTVKLYFYVIYQKDRYSVFHLIIIIFFYFLYTRLKNMLWRKIVVTKHNTTKTQACLVMSVSANVLLESQRVFFSQQNKICPFPKQDSCTYFWYSFFVLMTTNAELQQPSKCVYYL